MTKLNTNNLEGTLLWKTYSDTPLPLTRTNAIMYEEGKDDTSISAADLDDKELTDAVLHQIEYIDHMNAHPRSDDETGWEQAALWVLEQEVERRGLGKHVTPKADKLRQQLKDFAEHEAKQAK